MNRIDFSKPVTIDFYDNNSLIDILVLTGEQFERLCQYTPVMNFIVDTCQMQSLCNDMEGQSLLTAFCGIHNAISFFTSVRIYIKDSDDLDTLTKIEQFIKKQTQEGNIFIHFYRLNH